VSEDKLELKKYCIMAGIDDTALSFVITLSEEQYNFFCHSPQMQFTIGNGLHLALDRTELDSFSIQLMQ